MTIQSGIFRLYGYNMPWEVIHLVKAKSLDFVAPGVPPKKFIVVFGRISKSC